jgi:hypothetical protein
LRWRGRAQAPAWWPGYRRWRASPCWARHLLNTLGHLQDPCVDKDIPLLWPASPSCSDTVLVSARSGFSRSTVRWWWWLCCDGGCVVMVL